MTTKTRRILAIAVVLLAVAGGILTTSGNFSATTKNPTNTFASGTLVLSNTKQSASACLSTAGGTTDTNVNNSCDTLMALTVKKPGDSGTGRVTVQNVGSLAASALKFYTSSCTAADASGETYHGTGDMCANLIIFVQKYSDAGFTTKSSCLYGGGTATVCDYSNAAKTIANLASTYPVGTPLDLGAVSAGGIGCYCEIGVPFPAASGNTYQGRQASVDFTWLLQQ